MNNRLTHNQDTGVQITEMAKRHFQEERSLARLDGWFLAREIAFHSDEKQPQLSQERKAAQSLIAIAEALPLTISDNQIFAGTQRDAFARTYALINPNFKVENFSGYCDPTAVFSDIEPCDEIPQSRIDALREKTSKMEFVRELSAVYEQYENYTAEVAFFVEHVTGHLIPDFRTALQFGTNRLADQLDVRLAAENDPDRRDNLLAMRAALSAAGILAGRYADIAGRQAELASPERRGQLLMMQDALRHVPAHGARNLYEAIQSFMLLWMSMCLEQAPNPFAFSVGNADRLFEPFRIMGHTVREQAAALFKCLLVFFNVGDRSWAISQNLMIGGRDADGNDLTNECSYALLNAYYDMNLPQPILSVKLHKDTSNDLYRAMGQFFFTPGVLTPSFFNDDSIFEVLIKNGIASDDLADYAIAGCQEPLIMGKDNGNTTNSWLNMPKVLELTLNGGRSLVSDRQLIAPSGIDPVQVLHNLRDYFYQNLRKCADEMTAAANGAAYAVSKLPVPFLSAFMGGVQSGYDVRDTGRQGTVYNGSGCLIHGLSVIADSFIAVDELIAKHPEWLPELPQALKDNFAGHDALHRFLKSCPKFGNNLPAVDDEARHIAQNAAEIVSSRRNLLGNPFRPDFSSPTTHLLYGYWVGATPDGRKARDMLGYGVDPLYGEATQGLGFRVLSAMKLPYEDFSGGYASHLGVDPKYFRGETMQEKGLSLKNQVLRPLFFNPLNDKLAPYYVYLNVTTPAILRKVLANPKKYAPSGVYIMRIHGTFVNFLDLSPAIQQDIITRLDLKSTALGELS